MALSASIYMLAAAIFVLFQATRSIHQRLRLTKLKRFHNSGSPTQTPNTLLGLPQIIALVRSLLNNRFLNYVQDLFAAHGATFAYNTFGTQSIWTTEPENIQACLVSQAQDFEVGASRHKALIPLVGHSVLTTDGQSWQHHRSMMRRNFAKTQLENLDIFETHLENFLACVPVNGETFEIRTLLQKLTMDISSDFLLGCSTNSLLLHVSNVKDVFSEAWDEATTWLPLRAHLGALMDWIPHPRFFAACKTIHDYADQLVALALAPRIGEKTDGEGGRYVFLNELAKHVTDPVQLRDHAISILTAGRDTTAETISCIINTLVKHPKELALLRQEIKGLQGAKPSLETIKNMPYLRNVISEILRLYPVGPVNARIAITDTTLPLGGGPDGTQPVLVLKGQQVLYCVYGLHRRKDLYGDDANSFRPERWESRRQGAGWDFLPFNSGARNCLGQSFALTEVSYILIRFLQVFGEVEGRDERPWRENMGLILTNKNGTFVSVKRVGGA